MKEVLFYKLPSGRSPIEEFLDGLPSKEAQKVTWVLKLIEEQEIVSTKYYKKLSNTEGIIEVRVQLASNHFRLLGFEYKDVFVVLTNGFRKKDQKVPQKEIELAQRRRKECLENE